MRRLFNYLIISILSGALFLPGLSHAESAVDSPNPRDTFKNGSAAGQDLFGRRDPGQSFFSEPDSLFAEMEYMRRMMNRMFSRFDRGYRSPLTRGPRPQIDVAEEKSAYMITCDLPGMEEDAIDITVREGHLTIRAEREKRIEEEKEEDAAKYVVRERSYGMFQRSIPLPENVDEEKISAEYDNGVLTVTLPKKETEKVKQGRRIQVL